MTREDKLKIIGEAVMLHLLDDASSSSEEDEYDDAPHVNNDLDVSKLDQVDSDADVLKSLIEGTKMDVFKRGYKCGQLKGTMKDRVTKDDKSTKELISLIDELKK